MMKNYENDDADALFATMGTTKLQEISQLYEKVCSLSESVSTTTFNKEETCQRVVNRSPARMQKNCSFSGDFATRTVGKSPVRRSEQSSARRNGGSVRLTQSRDQMGDGLSRNQTCRRDAGERAED
ncbi:BEST plant protein match is: (TAIR:plant.1) protein, putative [Arachis hypogaea]|uniref:BEST plant protein match is: (TAIR:plant.1) protein, putative n=1 Tax=Arachis hypogaea TaxID=3818 RepID=A0A6B9V9W4_ARAHY|nr:BEST plant protein match is: (TAIR:plant.1) protein, putative [Arachis hypogaea]